MSLGRLLAAGKSLVGLPGGESRYRADKSVRLPKFGSPKNPFAPVEAPEEAAVATVTRPTSVTATAPMSAPVAKLKPLATEEKISRVARSASKAAGWLGALGRKLKPKSLNPLSLRPKAAVVGKSRTPLPEARPQQGELSLDSVKVLRNDLSDADLEVVRPAPVKPVSPVVAMTAEKLEPVGAALNRITTKFFGDQP